MFKITLLLVSFLVVRIDSMQLNSNKRPFKEPTIAPLSTSTFESESLGTRENLLTAPVQNQAPFGLRLRPNVLKLTKSNLMLHDAEEIRRANSTFFQRPDLTGTAWKSIQESFLQREEEIIIENNFNGQIFAKRLTDLIHHIVTKIDESLKLIGEIPFRSEIDKTSLSVMELGLTKRELLHYRHILALKKTAKEYHSEILSEIEKRGIISVEISLLSDLAQLSRYILSLFPKRSEQDYFCTQISDLLGLFVFIHKSSIEFWRNLYSHQRSQRIYQFCTSEPTSKTIIEMRLSGSKILAVLKAMREINPFGYIHRSISSVENKLNDLKLIQDRYISERIQTPQLQTEDRMQKKLRSVKVFGSPLYEKALKVLFLNDFTPKEGLAFKEIQDILVEIQASVEINLLKNHSISLNETLRESLMLELDPYVKSFLKAEELTVYLGILQAIKTPVAEFIDVNGHQIYFDSYDSVSTGDNLRILSVKAYTLFELIKNKPRMSLAAVGANLARKTCIALAQQFFWKIVSEDEDRVLELNRFLNTEASSKTVEECIVTGQRLIKFYNGKQFEPTYNSIKKKMNQLIDFQIEIVKNNE